ncbi:DegT/DnrJ/EryC1/StrS family aminotransferase [Ramlibacter sp. RBP-2]|uniref:DegT/DnrJ/EryC1/StrS family aminotransferase n=1 Tax=Ramlibacter lithotrophicus TaxID=2606681 RepID=A0A7X6DK85_9BURK|nr:DegT/DnrJ/EryC1/StrS family aminotransferase [Ramlibacter lithotrophicus]NKE68714.1 DegT/DnrJ/EryC1/StrS family aminotransferase [Ramlibacter lithotrophicus]
MSNIRLMKPYISFDDVELEFRSIFNSGMFTRGPYVERFQRELAAFTGAKHAFLATSATTALWACLKLLGIGAGDEVVVSDFSFPASANVVEDLGAMPVFGDVSLTTYNLTAATLEGLITPRTKAVIFVDALGNPTGISEITALCRARGIPLIEDAACAIGSSENGKRVGGIADLSCFSFHPRKLISTGEGGAITTDRSEWAEWLRVKLAHGAKGMRGPGLDFPEFGYNFRLPDLQAVMGSKQLARLDTVIDERNATRERYIELLRPLGFIVQEIGPGVRYNVQSMVFTVPEGVARDSLITKLKDSGVETTLGTYCLSNSTYYAKKYGQVNPVARALEANTITLPMYSGVDVDDVVDRIRRVL